MLKVSFSAILLGILFALAAVSPDFAQQKPSSAALKPAAAATAPGTATTAEPDVVLSQLQPAPTAAELALYKDARAKSPEAVRKFLATRKYLRQIWVAFPDGKLNADKAPPPSDDVDFEYALNFDEQMVLFKIKIGAASTETK